MPTPQYYVLYNGEKEQADVIELKLSEAFMNSVEDGKYEWTAKMININYGHNKDIMERCKPLQEYSILISKIREYNKEGYDIEKATGKAIEECITENVLSEYLLIHKAEVLDMVLTEFDEERYEKAMKEEGAEIGEERLANLVAYLYEAGRDEDIKLAIYNIDARKRLYKEFEIELNVLT